VLKQISLSLIEEINDYSYFTIYFNELVQPNENIGLRLHIAMPNFGIKNSRYQKEVVLSYFKPFIDAGLMTKVYNNNLEIKCLPFYRTEKKLDMELFSGGFDVCLHVPSDFSVTNNPVVRNAPSRITWDLDGKPDIERSVYIWRLRHFKNNDGTPCGLGTDFQIYASITAAPTFLNQFL